MFSVTPELYATVSLVSRWLFVFIALLLLFASYIAYTIWSGKRHGFGVEDQSEDNKDNPLWKTMLMLVVGAAAIAIGARLLVDNGTLIAEAMGVPESVIALTFVALGTSLPELVTAITALRKGHSALSLGNIVGATLFNLVLVSGLSTTLCPFAGPTAKSVFGIPVSLAVDIPVMFFVMLFMTLPALKRQKLTRPQGIILLCVYAAFCIFQFVR